MLDMIRNTDLNDINKLDLSKVPISAQYIFWEFVKYRNNPDYHENESNCDDSDVFFGSLDPFVLLRMACEVNHFDDLTLTWDIIESIKMGYYPKEYLFRDIDSKYKVTIIAEGNSDFKILNRAFSEYAPEEYRFLNIIDDRKFPLKGLGDLKNLHRCLIDINVENRILILFDNDHEGCEGVKKATNNTPNNDLILCNLPDLDELRCVDVILPNGSSFKDDVNGKASSIECFLDFFPIEGKPTFKCNKPASPSDEYQAEISQKSKLNHHIKDIGKPGYDSKKLKELIRFIITKISSL